MKALIGYRRVLAVREARLLIGASAVSQVGDWLYNAALLAYVYSATHSAAWVGAATIFRLLPYVLLGPLGGVIADRYPRRRVLVAGSTLRLVLMLALAEVVSEHGPVALSLGIVASASMAASAERPAALSLLPRLVGEGRIGPANALLHTVQDLAVVIGPAIGVLLLVVSSASVAFLANAATFAVAALLFSALGDHTVGAAAGSRDRGTSVVGGLRTARAARFVIPLAVIVAMVEFTYGAQTVLLVVYAQRSLRLGAGGYGLLLAASGAGGLISAVFNGQLATHRRLRLVVVSAAVVACAGQFVYAAIGVLPLALIVSVAGGGGLVCCEVVAETVLARLTPRDTLGRIAGLFDSSSIAAMVAGAVLASMLVKATSLQSSFSILGAITLLVTLSVGARGLRGLDAASRERSEALAVRLAIIERLPITLGTSQLVLEQLASSSLICPVPAGVDVVVQGSPAHAFYAIAEGAVVVHRNGAVLARLEAGGSFGERGLLDNAPRNATVTTETDATVLRIDGGVLLEVLGQAPMLTTFLDRSNGGRTSVGGAGGTGTLRRRSRMGVGMTPEGATVVVVGAGYPGKRVIYERMRQLGAELVVIDEPGHWSEQLVADGVASRWLAAPVTGDPHVDARAVLDALSAAGIEPDAVLTFWELSPPVVARVAVALGLPGNPVEAVDIARSKLRTRQASERAGLPTPQSRRVTSLDELYAAVEEIGFPSVVKPEFGSSAIGTVRVDSVESLPDIYWHVRRSIDVPVHGLDFRAGNDLVLEQYLDGVEFDIDLVLENGECIFSSVSQNWPTAEPSFQETGLHCPPDHASKPVGRLVQLAVNTVQSFGFSQGVLHVEGKCTTDGPRLVEVNARLGGGRIHEVVQAVWDVDLVEAHLRAALGLPQQLTPSRKPRCVVVNAIVYAPASGRLEALPLGDVKPEGGLGVIVDVEADVDQPVNGPDQIFSTELACIYVSARNLRGARSLAEQVLRDPPVVVPTRHVSAELAEA
jgi:biotin carboxylase/MFS family permease